MSYMETSLIVPADGLDGLYSGLGNGRRNLHAIEEWLAHNGEVRWWVPGG